jgi:hypothetical protein
MDPPLPARTQVTGAGSVGGGGAGSVGGGGAGRRRGLPARVAGAGCRCGSAPSRRWFWGAGRRRAFWGTGCRHGFKVRERGTEAGRVSRDRGRRVARDGRDSRAPANPRLRVFACPGRHAASTARPSRPISTCKTHQSPALARRYGEISVHPMLMSPRSAHVTALWRLLQVGAVSEHPVQRPPHRPEFPGPRLQPFLRGWGACRRSGRRRVSRAVRTPAFLSCCAAGPRPLSRGVWSTSPP